MASSPSTSLSFSTLSSQVQSSFSCLYSIFSKYLSCGSSSNSCELLEEFKQFLQQKNLLLPVNPEDGIPTSLLKFWISKEIRVIEWLLKHQDRVFVLFGLFVCFRISLRHSTHLQLAVRSLLAGIQNSVFSNLLRQKRALPETPTSYPAFFGNLTISGSTVVLSADTISIAWRGYTVNVDFTLSKPSDNFIRRWEKVDLDLTQSSENLYSLVNQTTIPFKNPVIINTQNLTSDDFLYVPSNTQLKINIVSTLVIPSGKKVILATGVINFYDLLDNRSNVRVELFDKGGFLGKNPKRVGHIKFSADYQSAPLNQLQPVARKLFPFHCKTKNFFVPGYFGPPPIEARPDNLYQVASNLFVKMYPMIFLYILGKATHQIAPVESRQLAMSAGPESDSLFVSHFLNGWTAELMTPVQGKEWQYVSQFDIPANWGRKPNYAHLPEHSEIRFYKREDGSLATHSITWTDRAGQEPVVVRPDSVRWLEAKQRHIAAEYTFSGVILHNVHVHLNLTRYATSVFRNVFNHPIRRLLMPHFYGAIEATSTFDMQFFTEHPLPVALFYSYSPFSAQGLRDSSRDCLKNDPVTHWKYTPAYVNSPECEKVSNGDFWAGGRTYWRLISEYVEEYFQENTVECSVTHPYWQEIENLGEDMTEGVARIESIREPVDMRIRNQEELKQFCRYLIYFATLRHSHIHFLQWHFTDPVHAPLVILQQEQDRKAQKTREWGDRFVLAAHWSIAKLAQWPVKEFAPEGLRRRVNDNAMEISRAIPLELFTMSPSN